MTAIARFLAEALRWVQHNYVNRHGSVGHRRSGKSVRGTFEMRAFFRVSSLRAELHCFEFSTMLWLLMTDQSTSAQNMSSCSGGGFTVEAHTHLLRSSCCFRGRFATPTATVGDSSRNCTNNKARHSEPRSVSCAVYRSAEKPNNLQY